MKPTLCPGARATLVTGAPLRGVGSQSLRQGVVHSTGVGAAHELTWSLGTWRTVSQLGSSSGYTAPCAEEGPRSISNSQLCSWEGVGGWCLPFQSDSLPVAISGKTAFCWPRTCQEGGRAPSPAHTGRVRGTGSPGQVRASLGGF